ncbi:hypothetical protein U1Q18_039331, partial [Sarracenia purpurea var. burkii]
NLRGTYRSIRPKGVQAAHVTTRPTVKRSAIDATDEPRPTIDVFKLNESMGANANASATIVPKAITVAIVSIAIAILATTMPATVVPITAMLMRPNTSTMPSIMPKTMTQVRAMLTFFSFPKSVS